MKTRKLDHTLAELHKLKNQIRVQLNKIRPYREPPSAHPSHSGKKKFPEKSRSTSLLGPPTSLLPIERSQSKKHLNPSQLFPKQVLRQDQRKHYKQSFKDQLTMRAATRRTSSSYLQIRPRQHDSSLSPCRENTSLAGVGVNDKSNQRRKPSKRIVGSYHFFNFDLI